LKPEFKITDFPMILNGKLPKKSTLNLDRIKIDAFNLLPQKIIRNSCRQTSSNPVISNNSPFAVGGGIKIRIKINPNYVKSSVKSHN